MHQQADVIVVFAQTDPGARHKGIGDDRMLGAASDGFKIAQTSLESGRTSTAACAVGIDLPP